MIEVHAEFPQREVIQANAIVDNEEKTISEVIISAKPEITGVTASVDNETGTPYVDVTETGTGTDFSFDLAFHNLKGETGEQGIQGETGETGNGITSIEKTSTSGLVDTYTVNYTNGGTGTFNVTNGQDGTDGQDGQAATVTVGTTTTGAAGTNASVVNSGTSSAAVFNFTIPKGDKGDTGATGQDGFSPSASVTQTSGGATISITDKDGTTTANITNGTDGADGADGFSPTATVTQSGDVTTISITDKNGTTTESIDLSGFATQTDLTNGLATKQDTISDLSTIRQNSQNGQSAYTTIQGYGDIVTHNTSEFATSAQGDLADTSIQPNDNISLLNNDAGFISGIDSTDVITALGYTPYNSTNPAGYTTNKGTVTSVNNTQPDANGNVTISSGSSTDVQINGTSITNQGVANILTNTAYDASSNKIATMSDIPSDEIFVAEYNVTTASKILTAFQAGKVIFCKNGYKYSTLLSYVDNTFYFISPYNKGVTVYSVNAQTGWSSSLNQFVTHGNFLPVGNSTTPVYINSSGVVTSTGLSIASSRFDGQWVQSFTTLMESSGTKSGVQISLSSYLPSDTYKYDVKFKLYGYDDDSSYYYRIETDIFNDGDTSTGYSSYEQLHGGVHSRQNVNIFDLPVGTGRYIKVYGSGADEISIYALGYRRIGTNS